MKRRNPIDPHNLAYVQEIHERYLRSPALVDESWRRFFASGAAAEAGLVPAAPFAPAAPPAVASLRAAVAASALVAAYRLNGHWAARLDPLGSEPPGHPTLDPAFHGITPDELEAIPAEALGLGHAGETAADVLAWLRATYTGTIGYEYEHLEDPERRNWLRACGTARRNV